MMIKKFSVLEIIKSTFCFLGNKKAIKPLFLSYLIMGLVLAGIMEIFPFFVVHENHIVSLNLYSVGTIGLLTSYFTILVLCRIFQYIFFDKEISYAYLLHPEKADWKLSGCLTRMTCSSVLCSYLAIVAFSLLGQKFLHMVPLNWIGILKYTLIFFPYFLILQCYRLPACIAGERIGFFRGFRKTNQFGMLLCVFYLIISILPIVIVFSLFVGMQFNSFITSVLVTFSSFVSIHLQGAFMAYMYAVLKDER